MLMRIERDHRRFREIVKGRIKRDLQKYLSQGEMIGRQGRDLVSIPVPAIDLPSFRYGPNTKGGVGAGEGEEGQVIGHDGEPQDGSGQAGNEPGEHLLEVEVSLEEMLDLLAEQLELPNVQPKGRREIQSPSHRYSSIHRVGPESLRHFRRTYRQALLRHISSGEYDAARPSVVPSKPDRRYRVWKDRTLPRSNAVIFYLMDVSGSMGDQQKEIVRIASFWIDRWLRRQYKGVERHFIIHDAAAREVEEDTFFRTRESGGTLISSAYRCARALIEDRYPWESWNVYLFQFSDGDNWAGEDTRQCMDLLREFFLPNVNLFCYGQVTSPFGSGQYLNHLRPLQPNFSNLITQVIGSKDEILSAIRTFLGKGL